GHGIVWAAIDPGAAIAKSHRYNEKITATLVQTTNLGLSIKDSPQNTLILVTRLDDAKPVAGAKMSIRTKDNKVVWSGTTDERGLAAAPNTDLRVDRKSAKEGGGAASRGGRSGRPFFIVRAGRAAAPRYGASTCTTGPAPSPLG